MPRDTEFKDVSSQVADGADAVKDSLKGIVSAAEEADMAHQKLSKTQSESLSITNAFSKAMDSYAKRVNSASRSVSKLASSSKGINTVSSAMAGLASGTDAAVASLDRAAAGGSNFTSSLLGIQAEGANVVSVLKDIDKEAKGLASRKITLKVEAPKSVVASPPGAGGPPVPPKGNVKFAKAISAEIDKLTAKLKGAEAIFGKLDDRTVNLKVEVEQLRGLKSVLKGLDEVDAEMLEADYASMGLAKAIAHLSEQNEAVAQTMRRAAEATRDTATSYKTLAGEIEHASTLMDLAKRSMLEGRHQAEGFANGLGATGGAAVAAGVAMVYLLDKVSGVIDGYLDAAKALAEYNVQAQLVSRSTIGADYSQLEGLRDELNLTKSEASEFYKTLRHGAETGLVDVAGLTVAATKLRDAFGGDPTEKLRDFIELVESIPTLEADLSVTASVDDQAASIFALAKAGKISTLIELQSAGLLGGIDVSMANPEDVKMLNEQQKANKIQEDIKDFLIGSLMPSIGPHIPVIAKTLSGTLSAVSGGFAMFGAISLFASRRQIAATRDVEEAVDRLSGRSGSGSRPKTRLWQDAIKKGFKKGGVQGAAKRSFIKLGGRGAGKAFASGGTAAGVKELVKVGKSKAALNLLKLKGTLGVTSAGVGKSGAFLSSAMSKSSIAFKAAGGAIAGPAAIIAASLGVAGFAAKKLGEHLEESGEQLAGGLSNTYGELLSATGTIASFAAAGAVAGSILPGIGTAAGAVVGGLVGLGKVLYSSMDEIGNSVTSLGEEMQGAGYNKIINQLGKTAERAGGILGEFGTAFKAQSKGTLKAFGKMHMIASPVGHAILLGKGLKSLGKSVFENIVYTDKEIEARRRISRSMDEFDASLKEAIKPNRELSAAQREAQAQTQESALALQHHLNAIGKAANTAKTQLSVLEKEVAGLDLAFLKESGGTAAQFDKAIARSTKATTDKFSILNQALSKRRVEIAKDSKLTAEQRRAALAELGQYEVQAAQEFVSAMSEVVAALLQTPGIITSELEREIAGQKTDFAGQTGGLGIQEFTDTLQSEMDAGDAALTGLFGQLDKIKQSNANRDSVLNAEADKAKRELISVFEGLPDVIKKRFDDVTFDIDGMKTDDLNKVVESSSAGIKDLNEKIAALTDGLAVVEGGSARGLTATAQGITEAINKTNDELKAAQEAAVKGETLMENELEAMERQDRAKKQIVEKQKALADLGQQQADIEEKIASWAEKQGANAATSKIIQAELLGNETEVARLRDENSTAAAAANAIMAGLTKEEAKAVHKLNKRTDLIELQKGLSQSLTAAEGALNAERSAEIAQLEDTKKVQAEIYRVTNEIIASIKKANAESTREVKQAERRAKLLEAEGDIAAITGKGMEHIAQMNAANVGIAEATTKSVESQVKDLKNRKSAYEEELKTATDPLRVEVLNGLVEELDDQMAELYASGKAAEQRIYEIFNSLDEVVEAAMVSPAGRRAEAGLDLASSSTEMAEFSDVSKKALESNKDAAIRAARERAKVERDGIKEFLHNTKVAAEALRGRGKGDEADDLESTAQIEAQARGEKSKTDEANAQLEAVRAATAMRMREVEIQSGMADVAMRMAKTFSGSASAMQAPLEAALAAERARLVELQKEAKEVKELFGESLNSREAEQAVAEQTVKVREQELDNVREMAKARMREVDIQSGLAETALDIAQTFDGSAESIKGHLEGALAAERSRLSELRKEYDELKRKGVEGVELEEAGLGIVQQEAKLRKQELELVEKMSAARMEELNIQSELISAAQDIAEAFDGSAETVARTLEAGLGVEKAKLSELRQQRKELVDTGKTGLELRKKDAEIIRQEVNIRKQELEIVKKVNELRMEEIGAREEGLEAELDYLGYIGAHYSRMLDIQGDMVALAREKYNVEQDTLDRMKVAGVTGTRLLQQETKVRKSWFDMQKKSVGVQKDVMEKILGSAFGQLAGDAGAIKGLNRTSNVMGIGKSRVYSAAGIAMGAASKKGGGTIAERSIMRQLKGMRGSAPKRLTAEEELAKAMHGTEASTDLTATNTKTTAAAVSNMNERASRRGSLFTHDEGAHVVLGSILAVAKEIAMGLLTGGDGENDSVEAAKDRIAKAIADASKKSSADSLKHQKSLDKNIGVVTKAMKTGKDDPTKGMQLNEKFDEANIDLTKSRKELERLQSGNVTAEDIEKFGTLEKAIESLEATIKEKIVKLIGFGQAMRTNVMEQPFAGAGFDGSNPAHLAALRGEVPQSVVDSMAALNADKEGESLGRLAGNSDYARGINKLRSDEEMAGKRKAIKARSQQFLQKHSIRGMQGPGMESEKTMGGTDFVKLGKQGPASLFGSSSIRLEGGISSGGGRSASRRTGGTISGATGGVMGGVAGKVPESVVSGRESTEAAIDRRTAFQARDGSAMAPGTSVAHMGPTGEGSVAGGASAMRITGELFLRSDNPFFKDQMATLVGEVLQRADVKGKANIPTMVS